MCCSIKYVICLTVRVLRVKNDDSLLDSNDGKRICPYDNAIYYNKVTGEPSAFFSLDAATGMV